MIGGYEMKSNGWDKVLVIILILVFCPVIVIYIGALYAIPFVIAALGLGAYYYIKGRKQDGGEKELIEKNISKEIVNNVESNNDGKNKKSMVLSDEDEYYMYAFLNGQLKRNYVTKQHPHKEDLKKAIIKKAKKEYKTLFETYVNTILDHALKNRGNVEIIDIMRQKRANHEGLKNTDYVGRVERYNRFIEKYIITGNNLG